MERQFAYRRNCLWHAISACFLMTFATTLQAQTVQTTAVGHDLQAVSQDELVRRIQELESSQRRMEQLLGDFQEQSSPELNDPLYGDMPSYFYEPGYYSSTGVGARPIADYAPPGYLPREQQEGPGVPELTPITVAPTDIQQRDFVARGMMPGSFLVPGSNTSVRLRGFARLVMLYDFDPIGTPDAFITNSIPVPQQVGENFNMSARMSRFGLETWTPTSFSDWNVHTLIEGDFFTGAGQAAGGGGNTFRLRHAFIDFGIFRIGQQNSVFTDVTSWPSVVDFRGPNSWINQRQPLLRVTLPIGCNGLYWAGGIERSFSDITTNGLGTGVQNVPDFTMHLRYEADCGHVQISGLFRQIGYRPTGGSVQREAASAISGSTAFHPWAILLGTDPVHDESPSGLTLSRIVVQATHGAGVGRFINDLGGRGFDGQVNPVTDQLELVDASAWHASYEHWYNEHWLTNFTLAQVNVSNNANQDPTTYNSADYIAGSLWWIPIPRLAVGIELLHGKRENLDGQSAKGERLNGSIQYNF